MVSIRLARAGAKKRPFYHVVVADSRKSRDGRFIERLGFYNPLAVASEESMRLDSERVDFWRQRGAKPTPAVLKLIRKLGKLGKLGKLASGGSADSSASGSSDAAGGDAAGDQSTNPAP